VVYYRPTNAVGPPEVVAAYDLGVGEGLRVADKNADPRALGLDDLEALAENEVNFATASLSATLVIKRTPAVDGLFEIAFGILQEEALVRVLAVASGVTVLDRTVGFVDRGKGLNEQCIAVGDCAPLDDRVGVGHGELGSETDVQQDKDEYQDPGRVSRSRTPSDGYALGSPVRSSAWQLELMASHSLDLPESRLSFRSAADADGTEQAVQLQHDRSRSVSQAPLRLQAPAHLSWFGS